MNQRKRNTDFDSAAGGLFIIININTDFDICNFCINNINCALSSICVPFLLPWCNNGGEFISYDVKKKSNLSNINEPSGLIYWGILLSAGAVNGGLSIRNDCTVKLSHSNSVTCMKRCC